MTAPLRIDIWSDIACPWCYIGKRRLEGGLAQYATTDGALPVEITYHSYELAPDTPVEFEGTEEYFLTRFKGMSRQQLAGMLEHVTEIAAGEGLSYDFDTLQHTNTLKAHQLLHHAKAEGKQLEMAERLFSAYFTQGRHVGRTADLADLAAEVGLDRDEVIAVLESGTYLPAVVADQQQAVAYGIRGVPFAVIDGRYGVSGAQESATFAEAIATAAADRVAQP